MREYGFLLTHIFTYKDRIEDFAFIMGKFGSAKSRILA